MIKSTITAEFKTDLKTVWKVVTDNETYFWRSDLSEIKILDSNRFVEYTNNGFSTQFCITVKEPYNRYEFDLENKNMNGHWIGIFKENSDGTTVIEFTEEIFLKNAILRIVAGKFIPIKKMQQTYVADLKKFLQK